MPLPSNLWVNSSLITASSTMSFWKILNFSGARSLVVSCQLSIYLGIRKFTNFDFCLWNTSLFTTYFSGYTIRWAFCFLRSVYEICLCLHNMLSFLFPVFGFLCLCWAKLLQYCTVLAWNCNTSFSDLDIELSIHFLMSTLQKLKKIPSSIEKRQHKLLLFQIMRIEVLKYLNNMSKLSQKQSHINHGKWQFSHKYTQKWYHWPIPLFLRLIRVTLYLITNHFDMVSLFAVCAHILVLMQPPKSRSEHMLVGIQGTTDLFPFSSDSSGS